ncbi:MAG: ABC transporter permease subunit [Coriobacteriales bacterium]|jgi:phosphonate transport system permease protein|nr:ABC transporter permease subunit [Coriobacteriales bacterium]
MTSPLPSSARLTRSGKIKTRVLGRSNTLLLVVMLILAAVTTYAFIQMDYGKVSLFGAFLDACRNFGAMAFTPGLDGHFSLGELVIGVFITLALASLTTLGGAVIAFALSLLAASNLSNRVISNTIKVLMSIARAIPTILWVLVFTVAIGLGAEAIVIGMLFHSIAYLVKAYSESFEEVDAGVIEALRATGATWWQIVARGVVPEKINEILSWTFIRFEVNFVAAVVVAGMAGAGGIGYELFLAGVFYFDIHEIGLIVYLCLAVSVALEVVATKLRKRYIVHR